ENVLDIADRTIEDRASVRHEVDGDVVQGAREALHDSVGVRADIMNAGQRLENAVSWGSPRRRQGDENRNHSSISPSLVHHFIPSADPVSWMAPERTSKDYLTLPPPASAFVSM